MSSCDVLFLVQSIYISLRPVLSKAMDYVLWRIQGSITYPPGSQHNSKMWEPTAYLYSKTAMYKNQRINNKVIN